MRYFEQKDNTLRLRVVGGRTITVNAPTDARPIFLKDGKQSYFIGKL